MLTFDVERAVKGKMGTTVEVTTANNGAACGIETSVSSKRMLFLSADRREMTRLLDLRLRTVAQFRWTGGQGILVRSNVVGIRQKSLLVAALPSGPTRVARRLPGQPDVIVAAAR